MSVAMDLDQAIATVTARGEQPLEFRIHPERLTQLGAEGVGDIRLHPGETLGGYRGIKLVPDIHETIRLVSRAAEPGEGIVELPRGEVDKRIDRLSQLARDTLQSWGKADRQTYLEITPWMQELLDAELVARRGTRVDDRGNEVSCIIEIQWDGWWAAERLRCGIYEHHKAIYQARDERDRRRPPGWGAF